MARTQWLYSIFFAMFYYSYDVNGIHEGAAEWLFQIFTRGAAQDLLNNIMAGRVGPRDERLLTYN